MKTQILSWLLRFLFTLPVILASLSVHELCHGLASYALGDSTAKYQGRLSLNPLRHIDPIGFICLLFFHVGWAKPVNVDTRFFKKPKRDMALTALAGPVSNFLLAFVFSFAFTLALRFGENNNWDYILSLISAKSTQGASVNVISILTVLFYYMMLINIGLGVFNLIPIPPLDGSKVLYAFLPDRVLYRILPYERYIQFILLLLLWQGFLSTQISWAVQQITEFFLNIAVGVIF